MNNNKKIIASLGVLCLMLIGCGAEPLAKLDVPEDLTISVFEDFDPSSVLSEVKEGTEVSYKLDEENSKLIISLVNGDKEETLETDVKIEHPLVSVKNEDITIDMIKGYDVNDLINKDEDTVVEESLDIDKGILTITAVNGDKEETLEVPVKIVYNNIYPNHCTGISANDGADFSNIHYNFLNDHEFEFVNINNGVNRIGTYDINTGNYVYGNSTGTFVPTEEGFTRYSNATYADGTPVIAYFACEYPLHFGN